MARARAIGGKESARSKESCYGDLTLDLGLCQVLRSGQIIDMPRLSYRLFAALARAAPNVLTHSQLVERVWDGRPVSSETLIQRIMLVRRALGDDADNPRYIGLVRGRGYRMLQAVRIVPARDDTGGASKPSEARPESQSVRQSTTGLRGTYLAAVVLVAFAMAGAVPLLVSLIDSDQQFLESADRPTIAVLPFGSRNPTDDGRYLGNRLHEAIIAMLAELDTVQVVSRSSVEPYRASNKPLREIARELGADAMLEGSLGFQDDHLQLEVELVNGRTIETVWSATFDETLSTENLFSIRTGIANAVAQALQIEVTSAEQRSLSIPPTNSLEAYLAYLRGVELLRRRTAATLSSAIEHFQDALRLDRNFVLPYVGLADGYQLLSAYSPRSKEELLPLALAAAEKAIAMDPDNGAAHTSLAMIHFEASRQRSYIFETQEPEPIFRRALRLQPNYATTYQWYGEYLSNAGRLKEAAEMYERGLELDSGSPILNHVYAGTLIRLGRLESAEAHFLRAIEIDPGFARAYQGLAAYYFTALGRVGDASRPARQAALLNPASATNYALLANIYLHLDDVAMAEQWLAEANRLQPTSASSTRVTALLRLYQGNVAEAARIAQDGVRRFPGDRTLASIATIGYLNDGRARAALELHESAFHWLSEDPPLLSKSSFRSAIDFARLLQKAGRHEESARLIQLVQQSLAGHTFGNHYSLHVMQASIHAINGDSRLAIDAIRQAIDNGWRRYAFYHFEYDPNLDSVRDHPEFRMLAEEVRADLAAQRRNMETQGVASVW